MHNSITQSAQQLYSIFPRAKYLLAWSDIGNSFAHFKNSHGFEDSLI